ncbi:MAG: DUF3445 domain-containing protein [Gammaproteobacteria bacterium]|nr:DUF3445 domain-containing protein [Pseudomonadales bacterium]MCP5348058.1 DUF3445 domain-containing protein [Pseudomonadales bacterium]
MPPATEDRNRQRQTEMRLDSSVPPIYLPETDQRTVLRLGLNRLDSHQWLIHDQDFITFYRNKLATRQQDGERVYQALPGSEPAQRELHALVLDHLLQDHERLFNRDGERLFYLPAGLVFSTAEDSLWQTSLLVQEDLCVLEPVDNTYRLTAASVCAPSNWKLEDKIGRSLDAIHAPVPGYGSELSARVQRLFALLKVDKPLLRYNWSIQSQPELFWREDLPQRAVPADDPNGLSWRVERQVLRRLPETGAIVFSIRIFIHRCSALNETPGFRENLARLLERLPIEQRHYKGLAVRQDNT